MSDKGYNGWRNYETWAVKMWLDNDEIRYERWRERTQVAWDRAENEDSRHYGNESRDDCARLLLADNLKAQHEEELPEVDGFAADLLNAAFGEVDWYEIAGAMLDDRQEREEYDAKERA